MLDRRARDVNLTNERGVDGTIRLLKNVMGLWLRAGVRGACGTTPSYDELHRLAGAADADVPLFDPDDDAFLRARRHAGADRRRLRALGQPEPDAAARSCARSSSRWRASTGCVLERLEARQRPRGAHAST